MWGPHVRPTYILSSLLPHRGRRSLRPPMGERKPPWVCAAVAPSPQASSTVRSAQTSEREPPWACSAAAPPPTGAREPPRACAAVRPPPRASRSSRGRAKSPARRSTPDGSRRGRDRRAGAAAAVLRRRSVPRRASGSHCGRASPPPLPHGRAPPSAPPPRVRGSRHGRAPPPLRPVGMQEPPRVSVGHTASEGNERENRGENRDRTDMWALHVRSTSSPNQSAS
ncbi:hypothetical protein C2845_PM06G22920 [Panicum miliaceum]|uniref:Uncharacterized protein n=1 Tax=Panicum miliaceum TaxID=4540 RepID=A0A3L6R9C8_PANMI|nr:hypothetical protein C2845_PM06G22920 [Panicum miliaceum]